MPKEAPAPEVLTAYVDYTGLMGAAGHSVDPAALARHLAGGGDLASEIEAVLREGEARIDARVERRVAKRLRELLGGLSAEIRAALGEEAPSEPGALADVLEQGPAERRDLAADAVLLNGHRGFLRPRDVELGQVRRVLAARPDADSMATVKLVGQVRRELARRGFQVTGQQVRRWFGDADDDVRVPYCLKAIVRQLEGEFRTGLVDLTALVGDQDPDEWLEAARVKLLFRSHSAMHKAIAEATSLRYDCVHKALSGRKKAKRIQAEIEYCLEEWLKDLDAGLEPEIPDECRGVPVEKMRELMARLEGKYRTKEQIYRLISERTGIKTGSVRRYFQSNGQLKCAPLVVCRCAEQLATEERPAAPRPRSYLGDTRVSRIAQELAYKANKSLARWRKAGDNPELELAYRELRRALIVTMKERRSRMPTLAHAS